MKWMISVLVIFILVIILLWIVSQFFSQSRRILEDWAAENKYNILSAELRWFRLGPFLNWTTSKNQVVYYVTVRTSHGAIKTGWVRCGGYWSGIFQNKAEVRWED